MSPVNLFVLINRTSNKARLSIVLIFKYQQSVEIKLKHTTVHSIAQNKIHVELN